MRSFPLLRRCRTQLAGISGAFLALAFLLPTSNLGQSDKAAGTLAIPDRPEKLTFPPLEYQPPKPEEFRVQLPSGPVAYVIPDRELPLVNVVIYLRVGTYLVPVGKEGLADLTGYLLARGGTQSKPANELDERLDFLAAHLNSAIGETHGTASLNLLSKDLDEGLGILRDVLATPRFQEDKLALRKQQILQDMQQRNDDSAAIEGREVRFLAYGENFWVNRHSTAASVQNLKPADLEAFQKAWIHPTNFVIAVNGDFKREDMIDKLDHVCRSWPFAGQRAPTIPTNTTFAAPGTYLINKEVNQGRVVILLPGIQRDDPNYFAVLVMNDILGGGGFTSRIMNRVRSDEGLAYSASSHFPGGTYFPATFSASFQSKSRTVAYATSILLEEIRRMTEAPPSDEELDTAKNGLIQSFPRTFSTKSRTASILAEDELTGRYAKNPTYWQTYRSNLQAVTKEDVQRVAKLYLTLDKLVVLVVGQKSDILQGHPDHPVTLKSLTGDRLVELPLRDPLTMKPLTSSAAPKLLQFLERSGPILP